MSKFFKKSIAVLVLAFSLFSNAVFAAAPVPPLPPESPYSSSKIDPVFTENALPPESGVAVEAPVKENAVSSESSEVTDNNNVVPASITNLKTGADSVNNAESSVDNTLNVETNNTATVDNNINGSLNTGGNVLSSNTKSGDITTGDANVALNIMNMINSNFISPDGQILLLLKDINGDAVGDYIFDPKTGNAFSLTGQPLGPSNSSTGSNSENTANISLGNSIGVINNNDSNLNNNIILTANTGENTSSKNTIAGDISTGDVNISVNLLNFLNSNFFGTQGGLVGLFNVFGNWKGDLVIPKAFFDNLSKTTNNGASVSNSSTGENSTNEATEMINNLLKVNNENVGDINNQISVNSNTGNNSLENNTVNGNVSTGLVDVDINLENQINKNLIGDVVYFTFVNVLGKWTGKDLISPFLNNLFGNNPFLAIINQSTGPDSSNSLNMEQSNSTVIFNQNKASINNILNIITNTGKNSSVSNTNGGNITTGDSSVIANVLNFANVNVVANKFVFLVVNVFGDWEGNIVVEKPKIVKILDVSENVNPSAIITLVRAVKDRDIANSSIDKVLKNVREVNNSGLQRINNLLANFENNSGEGYVAGQNLAAPITNFTEKNYQYFAIVLIAFSVISLSIIFRQIKANK